MIEGLEVIEFLCMIWKIIFIAKNQKKKNYKYVLNRIMTRVSMYYFYIFSKFSQEYIFFKFNFFYYFTYFLSLYIILSATEKGDMTIADTNFANSILIASIGGDLCLMSTLFTQTLVKLFITNLMVCFISIHTDFLRL